MVGDSCSAIRAALTTMYRSEHRTVNSIDTEQQETYISLGMVPVQASLTEFAHKYGMTEVMIAQEAALLQPFYDIADGNLREDECLKILVCAAAAVKFKLDALFIMCEAHLIVHFPRFMHLREKVSSILPPSSLYRMAEYLYGDGGQGESISDVFQWLIAYYLEHVHPAQEASAAILRYLMHPATDLWKLRLLV